MKHLLRVQLAREKKGEAEAASLRAALRQKEAELQEKERASVLAQKVLDGVRESLHEAHKALKTAQVGHREVLKTTAAAHARQLVLRLEQEHMGWEKKWRDERDRADQLQLRLGESESKRFLLEEEGKKEKEELIQRARAAADGASVHPPKTWKRRKRLTRKCKK